MYPELREQNDLLIKIAGKFDPVGGKGTPGEVDAVIECIQDLRAILIEVINYVPSFAGDGKRDGARSFEDHRWSHADGHDRRGDSYSPSSLEAPSGVERHSRDDAERNEGDATGPHDLAKSSRSGS
jgi:hypothetical protein